MLDIKYLLYSLNLYRTDRIINNQFILFLKFNVKELKMLSKDLFVIFKIKICLACIHDKLILFNNIMISSL